MQAIHNSDQPGKFSVKIDRELLRDTPAVLAGVLLKGSISSIERIRIGFIKISAKEIA